MLDDFNNNRSVSRTSDSGNALYCPYGLNVSIPAMMLGHLTLFGIAEVVYTTAVLTFVRKAAPEMKRSTDAVKTTLPLKLLMAALVILTPLGLLAEGTAWGEWGTDEIAATGAGFTPSGMLSGFSYSSLIPDYSLAGMPEWLGYILSAVIGAAILIIVFKLLSIAGNSKKENLTV